MNVNRKKQSRNKKIKKERIQYSMFMRENYFKIKRRGLKALLFLFSLTNKPEFTVSNYFKHFSQYGTLRTHECRSINVISDPHVLTGNF